MPTDPILCSNCGWTGTRSELDGEDPDYTCPLCETDVEFVD
ncbi:hypothetical protein VB773_08095 [Haloarculaceae archaeon H-GB2-1]|nr:hypothetical protein [Haloarculaceae archaeon H-GB1-1]MEA5386024.1 hypothetical protein [Haloarculaceae archaeon H-GB11]MEA5407529.1 hypothetical protein [Haloarculaceae archaeon H-GB2-1]